MSDVKHPELGEAVLDSFGVRRTITRLTLYHDGYQYTARSPAGDEIRGRVIDLSWNYRHRGWVPRRDGEGGVTSAP